MSDWQPIETAPRDGSAILLSAVNVSPTYVTSGWWDEKFSMDLNSETEQLDYIGAWTDGTVASWGCEENTELFPTHWMPLPPLPTP